MELNLAKWKEQKNKLKLTFDDLARETNVSRRQLQYLFQGEIDNPRIDTVQAIERALGLVPMFTADEIAQGVGDYPVPLSQEDRDRLATLARAEEVLGEEYVNGVMQLVEFNIEQKLKPNK